MRFVAVSFVFLGWAFYELSGGADFEPRGLRPPEPEPAAATLSPVPQPETVAASLVARPAIAPRRKPAAEPLPAATAGPADLARALALFPVGEPGPEPAIIQDDGRVVSLADLAARPAAITASPPRPTAADEPAADIREVAGARVNMRDGPGTIYPVIGRLAIGQQVEILDDSGTGWFRLRTLDTRTIGWASASLIADAR